MFYCEICEIFRNTNFVEHLPTERQQKSHALPGKKNESHLANLWRGQWVLPKNYMDNKCFPKIIAIWIWLNYLTSVALLLNFIHLDYKSMVVA